MQAPLLAHAMLHHPKAWPSQQAALGLLVSLRKYYQTVWVRFRILTESYCCRLAAVRCISYMTGFLKHPGHGAACQ